MMRINVIAKIRVFKLIDVTKDIVKLRALKLINEEWKEDVINYTGDLHNVISSYAYSMAYSKLKSLSDYEYYVEVEITAPGYSAIEGVGNIELAYPLLFPRPARLYKIGVVAEDKHSLQENGIDLGNIKWIDFSDDDIYVYEGLINIELPWKSLILETEQGIRVVTLNDIQQLRKPVETMKKAKRIKRKRRKRRRKRSKSK